MNNIVLLDTAWVMIAAFLVMFMHVGFTMVEVGFTQAKNALNIVMKNLVAISLGPIVFYLFGFGLMFGETSGGWFGFNAGSELAVDEAIPSIVTTTMLSAAAGGLASMIYTKIRYGMPDASLSLNGILAGLVSVTAGTASVSPLAAIAIGAIGGIILPVAVELFDSKLRIVDPVGAISVHGICGVWGTLAVGLFAQEGGLFYGGGAGLLVVQFIGVAAVAAWTLGTSAILFFALKMTMGIRVNETEESKGLDLEEHGTSAYQPMVAPPVKTNVTRPA